VQKGILEKSIMNNWQDVFPPKKEPKQNTLPTAEEIVQRDKELTAIRYAEHLKKQQAIQSIENQIKTS
jgi:hypothetical protein